MKIIYSFEDEAFEYSPNYDEGITFLTKEIQDGSDKNRQTDQEV